MGSSISEFRQSIVVSRGFSLTSKRMANSVDPDTTARHERSHLAMHCFQRYLYWSAEMKELGFKVRKIYCDP